MRTCRIIIAGLVTTMWSASLNAPQVFASPHTGSDTADGQAVDGTDAASAGPATLSASASVEDDVLAKKKSDVWWDWRGTGVSWGNGASALSFMPSNDITYNPEVGSSLDFRVRYWLTNVWNFAARWQASAEWTRSDSTTFANEVVAGNVSLTANASNFATLPGKIRLSAGFGFTLPTSEISQAQTLLTSFSGRLRASKTFENIVDGLTLGYSLGLDKNFHSYTTSQRDSPVIGNCTNAQACSQYLNFGGRNVSFRVSNSVDVTLGLADWLSVSAGFGLFHSFLYNVSEEGNDEVSHQALNNSDTRYALFYDVSATVVPWAPLSIDLGVTTFNAQRQPDQDGYTPFFNRNSSIYLNFNVDIAQLVLAAKYD